MLVLYIFVDIPVLRGKKHIRQTKQRTLHFTSLFKVTLYKHTLPPLHTPFVPSNGQCYHATGLEREHYANLVTGLQPWILKASYHSEKTKTSEIIVIQNNINLFYVQSDKKTKNFAILRLV